MASSGVFLCYSFGVISAIGFFLTCFILKKLRKHRHQGIIFTFVPVFLSMTLHYFIIGTQFNVLYFLKEYFLLISYTYICYFFLYQMYMLFERHIFLTYLGIVALLIIVVYLTAIAVYYIVASIMLGGNVFECSDKLWLMMTFAGTALAILFLSIGIVVNNNLKSKMVMYREKAEQQIKELWVLIFIFTFSRIASLVETIVFVTFKFSDCVIYIGTNAENSVVFILTRIITDYFTIIVVMLQIWKRYSSDSEVIDATSVLSENFHPNVDFLASEFTSST